MRKVAVYARCVSKSKNKKNNNFTVQVKKLKRYANDNNYQLVKIYSDKTFGTIDKQPGLRKLLRDAGNKKFDVVLIHSSDKLFRVPGLILATNEELRKFGVELKFVRDAKPKF